MITIDNLKEMLQTIGFNNAVNREMYIYHFDIQNCDVKVDFKNKKIIYPEGLVAERDTTLNFSAPENFVVLECIVRLLKKGYSPDCILLEKGAVGGHGLSTSYLDILVNDKNGDPYLLIECKTAGKEFDDAWAKMIKDGGQLFNYFNSFQKAQFLCLYTVDLKDGNLFPASNLVTLKDNDEFLKSNKKLRGFRDLQRDATKFDYFEIWKNTYGQDYSTQGLFEDDVPVYDIGKKKFTVNTLQEVDNDTIQKKYHKFATTLRKYNVSGRENAFDKLVNLFLAKIVDETQHPNELEFYWRGAAYDDYFQFQDRLQRMYKDGMQKFLSEDVTYIDQKTISDAFKFFKNDPDATRDKILDYFRQLKFFTNNDFAFLDVHNEQLFNQNVVILKEVVQMLQDIKLKTDEQNQFLGDFFEGFLDQGIKQSEGQFFTPLPIVRFLVSALPLAKIIESSDEIPKVIDYACGAGHFLNEYANQIKTLVKKQKAIPVKEYYAAITGVEKEYRLSKVAKVSAFMYGEDDIQIIYGDSLAHNERIKNGTFSILVANPPYSVKGFLETLTEEERERYELFSTDMDITTNNSIETFFVERACQLLKANGVAAIILPSSILSNGNIYIRCREIILKYFDIIAISEFGRGTFGKTGTNTVTLFLRRKSNNPDIAEHYKNRVECWFNDNNNKNEVFDDEGLIDNYCLHVGFDSAQYRTLMQKNPSEELMATEIFLEYKKALFVDTKMKIDGLEKAKKIRQQYKKRINTKTFKKLDKGQQEQEKNKFLLDFCIEIEKEKLYYYLLALANETYVLISKSPSKNSDIKKFLGYEWCGAKGNEGIKYIGSFKQEVQEGEGVDEVQETVDRLRGIKSIDTPLFNPTNLEDDNKINTMIRKNFNGEDVVIPESLMNYVKCYRLVDMIDFSRTTFDKTIRTTAVRNVDIKSKYKSVKLGYCVETIGGLWTGKKPPFRTVNVIRNTNFTMKGELNLDDVAVIEVEENAFLKRKLEKGDIIIEKSGGSQNQAVGRVVFFEEETGDYSFSNFTARLRTIDKEVIPKYLYLVLNDIYQSGATFGYQNGSSGLKNLDIERYLTIPIPIPPLSIQKQIVTEFEKLEEEETRTKGVIESIDNRITDKIGQISGEEAKLSYLAEFKNGLNYSRSNQGEEIKIIGVGDFKDNKIPDWNSVGMVTLDGNISTDYLLHEGDLLVVRSNGSANLVGRFLLIDKEPEENTSYSGFTIRIRPDKKMVDSKYLYYCLVAPSVRKRLTGGSNGTNIKNVNQNLLGTIRVPLPSLSVQQEIVVEIEKYENELVNLKAKLDNYATQKKSILKKYLV
ncbi:N-6 DNA methylase [Clostridium ihumii]|uniref:N-6 DNA methylase n=1 Tax=Clostridium ihumii TaxID=1470356 RepID=UPI00054F3B86|nr:N-6 DNA methylase [Clostridium ihumii]